MRRTNMMLVALSVALSMFLFSCQSDNPMTDDGGDDFGGNATSSILPADIVADLNSGDLDNPFNENYEDMTFEMLMGGDDRDPMGDRKRKDVKRDRKKRDNNPKRFGDDLNLTDEQKAMMERAKAAYNDCASEYMITIKAIHNEVFASANEARTAIMRQLKAGEITREEAHKMMSELRMKVQSALESNAELQRAMAGIKKCQEDLKTAMAEILTQEQKDKLNNRNKPKKDSRDDKGGDDKGTGSGR